MRPEAPTVPDEPDQLNRNSRRQQTINHVGEFGLINRIQKILPTMTDKAIIKTIGDDAAVLRGSEQLLWLWTCDIQIEGQHFLRRFYSPQQLGERAAAVNLSDIAAMGGEPRFALVSLGLPPELELNYFDDLIRGIGQQLQCFGAHIVGGNLAATTTQLILDISLLGQVAEANLLTRAGAQSGDGIYVTGFPGLSALGLQLLLRDQQSLAGSATAVIKHRQPEPRIDLAAKLAQSGGVSAMIDVSDGVAADLQHICQESNVAAELNLASFPFAAEMQPICQQLSLAATDLFLFGGEDYELLFTARDTPQRRILHQDWAKQFQIPISRIGTIRPTDFGLKLRLPQGDLQEIKGSGWDHFRSSVSHRTGRSAGKK